MACPMQTPISLISSCFMVQVQIRHSKSLFTLATLIDSGAAGNFISQNTLTSNNPYKNVPSTGAPSNKEVTHLINSSHLQVRTLYHEHLPLLIIVTTQQSIILKLPWLQQHNQIFGISLLVTILPDAMARGSLCPASCFHQHREPQKPKIHGK